MNLYFASKDCAALADDTRPWGTTTFVCSDWETLQALSSKELAACLQSEAFDLAAGKDLEAFCLRLSMHWYKAVDNEDITLFHGISLGKAYEGYFWLSVLIPFYRFQESARILLERQRPERVLADASLPRFKLDILKHLCGSIPLEIQGTRGQAQAPAAALSPWPFSSPFNKSPLRRLYNLMHRLLHPAPTDPIRRRWLVSHYFTFFPLYREIIKNAPKDLEIAFSQWPGRHLLKLWKMRNLRLLTPRPMESGCKDEAAWENALRERWKSLREDAAYRNRFDWNAGCAWPVLLQTLDAFFLREIKDLMKQSLQIKSALSDFPPHLIVVPYAFPPPERLLVEAGKRQGIPTVTVLHGLPGEYRPDENLQTDYLLVGGPAQIPLYENAGGKKERILPTGLPQLDASPPIPGGLPAGQRGIERVLILTQPPTSHLSILGEDDACEKYILQVVSVLRVFEPKSVFIRPHPSESSDYYRKILRGIADQRFHCNARGSLAHALSEADLVIGTFSTAILEAMQLNKRLILVNFHKMQLGPPFDGHWGIPTITSAEQLQQALEAIFNGIAGPVPDYSRLLKAFGGGMDGKNSLRILQALEKIENNRMQNA